MNSKTTRQSFRLEDFEGSGQYLLRVSGDDSTSYLASVLWKVGYNPTSRMIHLIAMTDGLVHGSYESKEALCRYLNDDRRGYRFATDRELSMLVAYIGTRRRMR